MIKPRKLSWGLILLFVIGWSIVYLIKQHQVKPDVRNDYNEIKQAGELRVCGEYDPFSFYIDSTGQHGFDVELIQSFASLHSLKLVYLHDGNLEHRIKGLELGRYDILMGPLPVLTAYKKRIAYTLPLGTSRLVLIQRASDNPIRNQVDLAGKRIALPAFSPYTMRINHLAVEISDSIFVKQVRVVNNEALVNLVLSGREEYAAMDERVARSLKTLYPDMDCSTPLSKTQFQAWAVRPGSKALLDSLNLFIETLLPFPG
jgi:ABC-type amino acid transport substrate-binding protein